MVACSVYCYVLEASFCCLLNARVYLRQCPGDLSVFRASCMKANLTKDNASLTDPLVRWQTKNTGEVERGIQLSSAQAYHGNFFFFSSSRQNGCASRQMRGCWRSCCRQVCSQPSIPQWWLTFPEDVQYGLSVLLLFSIVKPPSFSLMCILCSYDP